ncbi:MAG: MBL fold metallo-hydrolase [Stigonema ocellatum SAG 48.90 = DSM 106950]|nr:MBL fold metallo-hydrolase [Stigonema ocellatum SAG 48.90 = DSM 106950]
MKIHMIGHASIFVETQDGRILMDPVLWDPFCEGLNESCPKREVIHEKLPEFDFLVISHKHLDHFDVRSLAYLPKKVDVLIPRDKLIEDCLRKLGYSRIYPLSDFSKVRVGSTTMMTTRSDIPVPEFGMVFADETGVFWNAVDTFFSPQTIQTVRSAYPCIDFLLTPWHISMEGKYQYNQSISFPFSLYGYLFNLINLIQPKAIAPGAQGFKYINESSWQNQVVFPVTRERFCHDLKVAFPEIGDNIFTLDPGDNFTFNHGEYNHLAESGQYVNKIVDDRECLEFSPVNVGNGLVDSNPEKYDLASMRQLIHDEISANLSQFIQEHRESLFLEHRLWNIIYQLEVVFPDGSQKWHIDFSQEPIQVVMGRNPKANLFTYITASGLYSLIQKKRDWDYLVCGGEYRIFHKVYAINRLGIISAENSPIKDPIDLKFASHYIAGNNVYGELEKWIDPNRDTSQVDEDENPMLILGNVLLKRRAIH